MTGYESKRAAAQDKLDDDDTQIYQTELTKLLMESYDRGVADALEETKATLAQRPWVDLTDEEVVNLGYSADGNVCTAVRLAATYIKEKNT